MTPRLRVPRLSLGPSDRRALRLGAWVVIPALVVSVVIRPYVGALLDGRHAVARERAALTRELRLLAGAPRDRQLLVLARQDIDELAARLFGGADAVTSSAELARYVAQRASTSGLVLEQTETQTLLHDRAPPGERLENGYAHAAADSAAHELRVAIRARGSIRAVVDFLQAMENGPKLVRVVRVGVTRGVTGGLPDPGGLTLTATVTGLARTRFVADREP